MHIRQIGDQQAASEVLTSHIRRIRVKVAACRRPGSRKPQRCSGSAMTLCAAPGRLAVDGAARAERPLRRRPGLRNRRPLRRDRQPRRLHRDPLGHDSRRHRPLSLL